MFWEIRRVLIYFWSQFSRQTSIIWSVVLTSIPFHDTSAIRVPVLSSYRRISKVLLNRHYLSFSTTVPLEQELCVGFCATKWTQYCLLGLYLCWAVCCSVLTLWHLFYRLWDFLKFSWHFFNSRLAVSAVSSWQNPHFIWACQMVLIWSIVVLEWLDTKNHCSALI